MEDNICESDNLLPSDKNTNLNEATPAVSPGLAADVPKATGGMLTTTTTEECDDAISSTTPDKFSEELQATTSKLMTVDEALGNAESDTDFFSSDLSISGMPTEKITENVEDIVQDLENLLGESNDSYPFSRESMESSKLAESYDEVNSSNVEDLMQDTDLYQVEQTSVEDVCVQPALLASSVVPEINVIAPVNEEVVKEASASEPDILATTAEETTKESSSIISVDSELPEVVMETELAVQETQEIPETTDKVNPIIDINPLHESHLQVEEETPAIMNVVAESHEKDLVEEANTAKELNIIDSQLSIVDTETQMVIEIEDDDECKGPESDTETTKIITSGDGVSISEICPEITKEVATDSETQAQISCNSDQVMTVCEEPEENASELLEELIKDADVGIVDADSLINLNCRKDEPVENIKADDIQKLEKEHIELEECNENLDKISTSEVEQSSTSTFTNNDSITETILPADEIQMEQETEEPLVNLTQCDKQTDSSEHLVENKINLDDESISLTDHTLDVAHTSNVELDQKERKRRLVVNPEIQKSCNVTKERNVTTINTELVQPLTVEVDQDFGNQPETTTLEQPAEKPVSNEEQQKIDVDQMIVSSSKSEPTSSVDTQDENSTNRAPLKMTIAKHKTDNIHSILKIYDPNEVEANQEQQVPKLIIKSTPSSTTSEHYSIQDELVIPKITIKPVLTPTESQHSPRLTIKPLKPPETTDKQVSPKPKSITVGSGSPRITIKPVVKPEVLSPIKLTLRPYPKLEDSQSSPKLNIKPVLKPQEEIISVEIHHSPKITIKPIVKPPDETYTEDRHSPRITIKPVVKPAEESNEVAQSYSEERHSPRITIKPVVKPAEEPNEVAQSYSEERHSPRITIKPVVKPAEESNEVAPSYSEERHSPRITIKPVVKPAEEPNEVAQSYSEERHSPRITIKPVVKPAEECSKEEAQSHIEERHNPRITIKPVIKPPDEIIKEEEKTSPRITIKPVLKPHDESVIKDEIQNVSEDHRHSPRIIIKPIIKPAEELNEVTQSFSEERHSPRITIKPVVKPPEEFAKNENETVHSPRITIKPIVKPQEDDDDNETALPTVHPFRLNIKPVVRPAECSLSPKITIKPVVKPPELDDEPIELIDFEEQIKQERIVLKIAKNTKKEKNVPPVETEKLKKIKLKLSKQRGLARIVPGGSRKRLAMEVAQHEAKRFKTELPSDLTISLIPNSTSSIGNTPDITITRVEVSSSTSISKQCKQEAIDDSGDLRMTCVSPVEDVTRETASSPIVLEDLSDPLAQIPVFEITLETAAAMSTIPSKSAGMPAAASSATSTPPRKRGRPRKVPLEVREEFQDLKEEEPPAPVVEESTRPKRSCRGTSVKTTLGIKPRKPRAPSTRGKGAGGGGKRTVSTRAATAKKSKERKPSLAKQKLAKELMLKEVTEFKDFEIKDAEFKQVPLPGESSNREVVIYEEETRMSAENSSRAQTPAKQVLVSVEVVEESQSSVQSNATTESGDKQKVRKGPRLEVHQEPEGEVISADKLAEYSWGGGGPYMLQEQVAQFLGIKSFKRKYPGIQRRTVDMQERDFIRESCLASEAMCDMGLTAVRSEDILDIMYTDFQNKYEEYCKHQRDRQAKDVSNKQKALSLAASQEKTKLDIVEQAVQSAFQWNASFNKARREHRRACMDLQTFTVHFPKGKMKQVNKPSVGHYPLALVPGQYTDYYKKYSPLELNNLPLNTTGCKTISISSGNQDTEESQSDGSGSDSDSSSSDSDSSYSGSSGAEDCKMCSPAASSAAKKVLVH